MFSAVVKPSYNFHYICCHGQSFSKIFVCFQEFTKLLPPFHLITLTCYLSAVRITLRKLWQNTAIL